MSKKKAITNVTYKIENANLEIDYDKLVDAIMKAHKKNQEDEENKIKLQKQEEHKAWKDMIGLKECPENIKWTKKIWFEFKNNLNTLRAILAFKPQDATKPRLSFAFIRLGTSLIYGLYEFFLYFIAVLILILPFVFDTGYTYILLAIPVILFARLFRIAKLEVDNIEDKEILNLIFSANMTFVSIVLALIALFKK